MSARDYLVLKFYIPEYGIQSQPIAIPASEVREKGIKWAIREARNRFLRNLRHKWQGETIHRTHMKLWKDGRVTFRARLRKLTSEQLSGMRSVGTPRLAHAKVGWERPSRTAKERRERFLKEVM
jgi:hypothetical protein